MSDPDIERMLKEIGEFSPAEPQEEKEKKPETKTKKKPVAEEGESAPQKAKKEKPALTEKDLEAKFDELIEKSEPLKKLIEKRVDQRVEEKIQKKTTETVLDESFFIDIQKFISDYQALQKPIDFTSINPNHLMKWIANKVNADPKSFPAYFGLIQRLFDQQAFDTMFTEDTKKAIPYETRKSGGKPGADLNNFRRDMEAIMTFLKDQYPDLIQNNMGDYTFFVGLFKIYSKHLMKE